VSLQDLLDAAERLLRRSAAGDAHAVFEPDMQDVYDGLLALQATEPAAARAAGRLAWARHLDAGDPFGTEDLTVAITLLERFPDAEPFALAYVRKLQLPDNVEAAPPGAPRHPGQLIVGAHRMYREQLAGDHSDDDLGELGVQVSLVTLGVAWIPPESPRRALALDSLAFMILAWIGATGSPTLLPVLVDVRRAALAAARAGEDQKNTDLVFELGVVLILLFAATGDAGSLGEAESAIRSSGRANWGPGDGSPAGRVADQERLLYSLLRFAAYGGPLDYRHQAVAEAHRALVEMLGGAAPEVDDSDGSTTVDRLGVVLTEIPGGHMVDEPGSHPRRTATVNLAHATIEQIAADMERVPRGDHGRRAELFAELSDVYRKRFVQRRRADFLDRAVELARVAVRRCPSRDPRRRECHIALLAALLDRYALNGGAHDRDDAIAALRPVAELPDDFSLLASLFLDRYQMDGRASDLGRASELAHRAVDAAADGSDAALVALGVLGQTTVVAHDAGMSGAGLDDGIDMLRAATDLRPEHVNHNVVLVNLAASLIGRYRDGGTLEDLDEAITWTRTALANRAGDGSQWARRHEGMSKIAAALTLRFEAHGALSDLDEAIELSRQILTVIPADHPLRTKAVTSLAERLAQRAARTGAAPELAEALHVAEQAIADAGPDSGVAELTLARVLATPLRDADPDGGDGWETRLLRAIALRRSPALEALEAGNGVTLAALLQELFLLRAPAPAAIPLAREAEALYRAARNPDAHRLALASVLYERSRIDPDRRALDEAAVLARTIALDDEVPAPERMAAARIWGAARAQLGDWAAAADGFACAVGLLSQLAPRTLARTDQEFRLAATADLPSDAAAAALRAGDPARAVRLFEAARGVLWAQLGQDSAALDALAAAAPALATRFTELRAELGTDAGAAPPDRSYPYGWRRLLLRSDLGTVAERRRALGAQWNANLAEIRALAGFADFPAPPVGGKLHPGVDGPVVVLTVSVHGSYALILHPGDRVVPLPLPDLTPEAAHLQVSRLRSALQSLQNPKALLTAQNRAETAIGEMLAWLWDAVTGPVLDHCPEERVWWVPAGPLAALPVHAAGAALGRTCSSYSPTLAVLRRPPVADHADRLLVVAMPETPDAPPLPGVRAETQLLEDRFHPVVLSSAAATKASVTAALADCEVAHFACHSADGRLLLHDHRAAPLTLLDVAHVPTPEARLAYLSACATSLSNDGLPDEAAHLAAAFLSAGFPQAVATLWPVDDEAALRVTTAFYDHVRTPAGTLDPSAAAAALRSSTREMAAAHPRNPSLWACYVHVGR
jgi:CHAT domain-containing protein/tetratricopeptide (TPR) repeat protein